MQPTVEMFKAEIVEALRSYDRFVVCLDKTPEDCEASLQRLLEKAIRAYENRAPGLRHGIALDNQVTIIFSQPGDDSGSDRPLCGIYFNLSSPYHKKRPARAVRVGS